ncbi:3-hydroxyacyl-CoA dehydrogenase NAD-binding domain-containing protein, partial [Mycobacterium persicum]
MTGSYTYTFDDIRNRPVAVIGSGTLGRRIALMFASRGGTVRMYARRAEQHAEATQYVAETLPKLLQDRGFGEIGVAVGTSSLEEALDGAWLAVESVPERLEIKIPLWGQIDQAALPDTIFATNSSSFPSPEPVKPFETCQAACSVSVFSFGGSLIQAASGSL